VQVYNRSGYPQFTDRQRARGVEFADPAQWLTAQIAPRAKIFRRDQASIETLEDLQHMMRYNDWRHDPYSGHPVAAVAGRGDLAKVGGRAPPAGGGGGCS